MSLERLGWGEERMERKGCLKGHWWHGEGHSGSLKLMQGTNSRCLTRGQSLSSTWLYPGLWGPSLSLEVASRVRKKLWGWDPLLASPAKKLHIWYIGIPDKILYSRCDIDTSFSKKRKKKKKRNWSPVGQLNVREEGGKLGQPLLLCLTGCERHCTICNEPTFLTTWKLN